MLSQLFGDRAVIANATGCSSIYGGNLPTTPWAKNNEGRGPAWSNSLFEDNAEFGLGFRLSADQHRRHAEQLLTELAPRLEPDLVEGLLGAVQWRRCGEPNGVSRFRGASALLSIVVGPIQVAGVSPIQSGGTRHSVQVSRNHASSLRATGCPARMWTWYPPENQSRATDGQR